MSSSGTESNSVREEEEEEEEEQEEAQNSSEVEGSSDPEEPERSSEVERSSEPEEAEEEEEEDDNENNDVDEEDEEPEEQDPEEEDAEEEEEENGYSSPVPAVRARGKKRASSAANAKRSKRANLTTLAFPISRVRRLVKSEVDVQWIGAEAGFLIAKATELFLETFVESAFEKMIDADRTTLNYKDLASHVSDSQRFDFLADFVPLTVPASTALSVKSQADA